MADEQQQAAAEWVPMASLLRWDRNPRRNDATVPQVADSIRRFGFGAPLVARAADRVLVAGHTRLAACERLATAWEKATTRERSVWHPDAVRVATKREVVARLVDLDEHDAQLLALADNKIPESSEWDSEALGQVLAELRAEDLDLVDGTGFTDEQIAKLIDGDAGDGATGGDPGEGRYREQFGVIVICKNEQEQEDVYRRLQSLGLACRVVVT